MSAPWPPRARSTWILAARGIQTSEEARQRIFTCTDAALLDRWMHRVLKATTLSDVLGGLAQ